MKYFANMFQAVSMDFVADELADKVLPTLVETAYGQSPAGEKDHMKEQALGLNPVFKHDETPGH